MIKVWVCIFVFLLGLIPSACAARTVEYFRKDISIASGKTHPFEIQSQDPVTVKWQNKQEPECQDNCVEARQIGNPIDLVVSGQYGAAYDFQPIDGAIRLEFKNISQQPVVIDIYSEKEVCDAEACEILKSKGIEYPFDYGEIDFGYKRVLLARVDKMETSKDGSYSRVQGETIYGTPFDVILIWWLIEQPSFGAMCREWIPKNAGKEQDGQVYHFSGSTLETPDSLIFTDAGCSFMDKKEKTSDEL